TGKQKLSTSYPHVNKVIHRCRKVIHKLSTGGGERVFGGEGRGANVCSSRRASKRFLQIFKTRVIKLLYPTYPNVLQRIPPSSKAILLQLNVSQRPPTYSKAILRQSIRISM